MTTFTDSATLTTSSAARARAEAYPAGSLRFDLAAALLACWFVLGLYLDGWAHNNLPGRFETFFTPWHGVLYSGYLASTLFLFFHQAHNQRRGHAFIRALPQGYWLSLVGVMLFGLGGAFDLLWHNVFGFEEDVQALLSPAHLLLATSGVLFSLGPLRAAWRRPEAETKPGWAGLLPAWLSICLLLSVFTFFTQYSHFLGATNILVVRPARDQFLRDAYGVASVFYPAAFSLGLILFALRRWALPPGSLTLLLGSNSLLMFWMSYPYLYRAPWLVLSALVASLLGDGLLWLLKPSAERVITVRLFSFLLPIILFGLYFVMMILTSGTWWVVHMWLGVTFQAGVIGLLISYLVFPPRVSDPS
ncbi:MAG: hypothetical protein ACRDH2_10745 [Anaerolineales bacterium]